MVSLSHSSGYRGSFRDSQVAQRHLVLMSCKRLFVHPGRMSGVIKSPFAGLIHHRIYHLTLAWEGFLTPAGWGRLGLPGFCREQPLAPGTALPTPGYIALPKTFSPQQRGGLGTWGHQGTKLEHCVLLLPGGEGGIFAFFFIFPKHPVLI